MKSKNKSFNKKIAECVGLWLAEGDKKCNNEINFSNNCWFLVKYFHSTISTLFKKHSFNIRIYVYTAKKEDIKIPIENIVINRYIDKQATKPYFIWRLASVQLNKKWKKIVKEIINDKDYYPDILRGFFAGEGNIKIGEHASRTIRISQAVRNEFIENILKYFKIEYRFRQKERNYYITHKENWNKIAEIKIADLHPIKKKKFWKIYQGFKENHYKNFYIKNQLMKILIKPYTSNELALKFVRSQARIYDILGLLKKEDKIKNFRVRSKDYWIRKNQNIIILSKLKYDYIQFLRDSNKSTKDFSKYFNVDWGSSFKRLKELRKLGLVKRNKDKTWRLLNIHKKVVVI